MSKYIDITGQEFTFLTVESFSHTKNRHAYFNCKCKCGNNFIGHGASIRKGRTKSCGCLKKISDSNKMKEIQRIRRRNLMIGEFSHY